MGGSNSVFRKPLGKTGDKLEGTVLGDGLKGAGDFVALAGGGVFNKNNTFSLVKGAKNVREGLGEITGANAQRKAAMDQQQANEEATKRAADASDAAARAAGGDPTAIFLATGKKKKGGGGTGTGSAGTGSSRDTGIQT